MPSDIDRRHGLYSMILQFHLIPRKCPQQLYQQTLTKFVFIKADIYTNF